jgi:hypothetical protein
MTLLTVDVGGANQTLILFARAGNAERRTVGARRFAFAGNERSMIRAESVVAPIQLAAIPAATAATIRTLFADGAAVSCEGDVFNNGNAIISCVGEIVDEMEVGGTYWNMTLSLTAIGGTSGGTFRSYAAAAGTSSASATILGKRYLTAAASGRATTSVAYPSSFVRQLSAAANGSATTVVATTKQQRTASAAGSATTSARTTAQQRTVLAAGRATTTVTGTKIP